MTHRKPNQYQWQFSDGATKRVDEMSLAELQQALCQSLDLVQLLDSRGDRTQELIAAFLKGK